MMTIPAVTDEIVEGIGRFYTTPDGVVYPSVTTVLQEHSREGIEAWKARVGDLEAAKISKAGLKRGTRFHHIMEEYLLGRKPKMNIIERESFERFKPVADRITNIRHLEIGLWSDHLRLAGRADCIADFDGKLAVIDFKTAKSTKLKEFIHAYFMQAAGYCVMYEERTGIPINKTAILISVDNEYPQVFVENRDNWVPQLLYYRDRFEMTHGGPKYA